MRLRTTALATAATLLTLLALSTPGALASEANTIIERCVHGQSLSGFSQNGYREALKEMPTSGLQYSPCEGQIRRAELAAAGGGSGGASGAGGGGLGGATSSTPIPLTAAEQQQVLSAHKHGSTPVLVGSRPVEPGVVHADVASAASALPSSLLAVLAVLLGGTLLFVLGETLKRARARRHR